MLSRVITKKRIKQIIIGVSLLAILYSWYKFGVIKEFFVKYIIRSSLVRWFFLALFNYKLGAEALAKNSIN